MTSTERVLAIRDLSVNFGGLKALSGVNIDLHRGEVLGLIGPNGAGKTTVFNALSGLVTPASGSLELYGRNVKWPKPYQLVTNGIARTLQGVGLFPDLTVSENVMLGASKFAKAGFIQSALGLSREDEEAI
ncbi:MAG: ATP-binding cassette domain-containing protein, partial [Candidatus Nanopelagicaceae bacterium]